MHFHAKHHNKINQSMTIFCIYKDVSPSYTPILGVIHLSKKRYKTHNKPKMDLTD